MNQSADDQRKATLIVAPGALLDQWQMEIGMKTNCGLQCVIYHGKELFLSVPYSTSLTSHPLGANKPKSKRELMKYDIGTSKVSRPKLSSFADSGSFFVQC